MRWLKQNFRNLVLLGLAVTALTGSAPVAAAGTPSSTASTAASSNSSSTSGVTQSYNADGTVQIGMIVKLKDKDPTTVVPLDYSGLKDMLGVVVPASNATIVLTPQNVTQQQVLVATTGQYSVLVSSQNGPIKVGDYLTVSAVAGVAMKAGEQESEVLGKAAGDFSANTNVIGSVTLKNSAGTDTTVSLGRIPVALNIARNPLYQKSADYVPSFLSKVAVSVANKPVTAARIYLSMALLLVTSLVTGNMLYSGVRSGMTAIGRNPLSKKSIIKSLIETVIAGLIIFVVGILAVYLLLKL